MKLLKIELKIDYTPLEKLLEMLDDLVGKGERAVRESRRTRTVW